MNVSQTIASQIGNRAFTMMGAKNLFSSDKGLSFKIGHNAGNGMDGRVSHITITLDPSDTYTVEFTRCNTRAKIVVKVLGRYEGIHADGLHSLIQNETGLYLSL